MQTISDYVWKVVVGGAGGTGKTSILHRYIHDEFITDMKMTVGVQFHTQRLNRNGKIVTLSLWDLAGQNRFRFVLPNYIIGANVAMVLFDMSRVATLLEVDEWIELFRKKQPNMPIVLVGSKYDLLGEQEAIEMMEAGKKKAEKTGCVTFIATSAKMGVNVSETIEYIVDILSYNAEND